MIKCVDLAKVFLENDLTFFSGVPDSTFKDWLKYLADGNGLQNIVACNECEAAAISAGYHLATGKIGVVYMQNSGLGKVVNPLTSLLSKEVYSIPTLFMIGWRGEPGEQDEPQHRMMGRIMLKQLEILEIPYKILPNNIEEIGKIIKEMKQLAETRGHPSAIIIKKGTLEEYVSQNPLIKAIIPKIIQNYYNISNISGDICMKREDAIKTIVDNLEGSEVIVSTTGKASRELFEYREKLEQGHGKDFLTVGSMGCSSAIALGIALNNQKQRVYVFDGDGAALMQMGTIATIGHYKPKNLRHIIFDNQVYDSTGKQPSISGSIDFGAIALASGYLSARVVNTPEGIRKALKEMEGEEGLSILRILIDSGARKNLGRPTITPIENKKDFMEFLKK
jgi:phosphonopyruvate decarboxylase